MKALTLFLTFPILFSLVRCGVPKKYRNPEDKSLYCNVCENIMIDLETAVMEQAAELSGTLTTSRVDSKGKRQKRSFVYEFDDDDIDNALDGVCSSWGSNLGTSQKPDGSVEMLKSGALSGSFSGSLNFGGEASTKVLDMCRGIVKKQRQNMIAAAANNDYEELRKFCKENLTKKCKKIKFPKEIGQQIKDLQAKKEASGDDADEGESEDQVELMEDDEEDGKVEL